MQDRRPAPPPQAEDSDETQPKGMCNPFRAFFKKRRPAEYQPFQNLTNRNNQPKFPSSQRVQQMGQAGPSASASSASGYPDNSRRSSRHNAKKSSKPPGWGRQQYELAVAEAEKEQIEQAIRESINEMHGGSGYPARNSVGITSDWKNLSEAERVVRRNEMAKAAEARMEEQHNRGIGNKQKAQAMRDNSSKQELLGQVTEMYKRRKEDVPLQLGLMSLQQLRRHHDQLRNSELAKANASSTTTFSSATIGAASSAAKPTQAVSDADKTAQTAAAETGAVSPKNKSASKEYTEISLNSAAPDA